MAGFGTDNTATSGLRHLSTQTEALVAAVDDINGTGGFGTGCQQANVADHGGQPEPGRFCQVSVPRWLSTDIWPGSPSKHPGLQPGTFRLRTVVRSGRTQAPRRPTSHFGLRTARDAKSRPGPRAAVADANVSGPAVAGDRPRSHRHGCQFEDVDREAALALSEEGMGLDQIAGLVEAPGLDDRVAVEVGRARRSSRRRHTLARVPNGAPASTIADPTCPIHSSHSRICSADCSGVNSSIGVAGPRYRYKNLLIPAPIVWRPAARMPPEGALRAPHCPDVQHSPKSTPGGHHFLPLLVSWSPWLRRAVGVPVSPRSRLRSEASR